MPKLSSMLLPAVASLFVALASGAPARAESLSCTSVNGKTVCTGSGAMSCHTIDGGTVCAQGSSTSCTTVGNRTVCRSGSNTQIFRTDPPPEAGPPDEHGDEGDARPQQQAPSQSSRIEQDEHRQTLSIERGGQRLRIRNGALDLQID